MRPTTLTELATVASARIRRLSRGILAVLIRAARAIKPVVDILVPFVLIWLAVRTDELQRITVAVTQHQAEIAADQSTILRQQTEIAAVQNMAAFGFVINDRAHVSGSEDNSSITLNNDGAPVAAIRIYAFSYWIVTVRAYPAGRGATFPIFRSTAYGELTGRTSGSIAEVVIPFRRMSLDKLAKRIEEQEDEISDSPPKPGRETRALAGMPAIQTVIEIHYTDRAGGAHKQTYRVSSSTNGWERISRVDAMTEWSMAGLRWASPAEGVNCCAGTAVEEDQMIERAYNTILEASKCAIYDGRRESVWRAKFATVPEKEIDRLAAQYVDRSAADFDLAQSFLPNSYNNCEE